MRYAMFGLKKSAASTVEKTDIIRNRKAGPGWVSCVSMGALYTDFSIITPEFYHFVLYLSFPARLILMRIRFRASDFGQVAKTNVVRANRNRLLVQNWMRRWCPGQLFVCSCDSAVRFLDSEKSCESRLLLCLPPRRVHFARPWTSASNPALTYSSPVAKRCDNAFHT